MNVDIPGLIPIMASLHCHYSLVQPETVFKYERKKQARHLHLSVVFIVNACFSCFYMNGELM